MLLALEDLRRECAAAMAGPSLEDVLSESLRENPKLTQTKAEKIAREAGVTEGRNEVREQFKRLGGITKQGPREPRKKRAAPTA